MNHSKKINSNILKDIIMILGMFISFFHTDFFMSVKHAGLSNKEA